MKLQFSSDQRALLDAVERIVAHHATTPALPQRCQWGAALWEDLQQAGVFEATQIEELGPVAAAALVMAVAQSPLCVEVAASAFIAPRYAPDATGPIAFMYEHPLHAPQRFLPVARSVLHWQDGRLMCASLQPQDGAVQALSSLFAYPMGQLQPDAALQWYVVQGVDGQALKSSWQVALAAELVGGLEAGLQSVLVHVRDRRQFGRPLGSLQAIQHRLAECATLIEGGRWLVLRAAASEAALDACLALGQCQRMATRVSYDLHQFMGAMGLTLEHPLHRWTYRTKLLRSELGGAERHFVALAQQAWPSGGAASQEQRA